MKNILIQTGVIVAFGFLAEINRLRWKLHDPAG